MKKLFIVLISGVLCAACNNNSSVEQKVDSLNERKDTLTNSVDSTVGAKVDSVKERGRELKEGFDSSIEAKKDSLKSKQ